MNAQNFDKFKDFLFILLVTGFFSMIANCIGYKGDIAAGSIGALVLVALAMIGVILSMLPGLNRLPLVFWVSAVGVAVSIPGFPGGDWIVAQANNINLMATTTPILAYAGLCVGKDLEAFKKLSWRIVPVAWCVAAGTFLCATMMAEFVLHLEGVI